MNRVLILMATYNGQLFIKDQIDSIKKQTYASWDLLISDDHSTDQTVSIIESEINGYPNIHLITNQGQKGVLGNFSFLISHVDRYEYIMFCDQDDIWCENKIALTYQNIIKIENENGKQTPILVYTDKMFVDSELNIIDKKNYVYSTELISILAQNPIYGCTMMINRALLERAGDIPHYMKMHDTYFALMAAIYGIIYRIPEKLIKYRQHNNNVTGGMGNYSIIDKIRNWKRVNYAMIEMLHQNFLFCSEHKEKSDSLNFLKIFDFKGAKRLIYAKSVGYRRHTFMQTLRLYFVLLQYTPIINNNNE